MYLKASLALVFALLAISSIKVFMSCMYVRMYVCMYVCMHVCINVCITFSFYVDTSCPHCPDSPTVDFIPFLFFRSILPLSLGAFLGQGRWRKGDAGSHSKRAAVCLIEAPGQGRQEANIEAFFTPFVASHPTANAMPRYDPVSTTLFACFRDLF